MKIKLTSQKRNVFFFSRAVNTKICKTKRHRTLYIKILQSHKRLQTDFFHIVGQKYFRIFSLIGVRGGLRGGWRGRNPPGRTRGGSAPPLGFPPLGPQQGGGGFNPKPQKIFRGASPPKPGPFTWIAEFKYQFGEYSMFHFISLVWLKGWKGKKKA